jgi:hypothetical protein
MKTNPGSSLLCALVLCGLGYVIAMNPPGGVRWAMFFEDSATWTAKTDFLLGSYVWPAFLSLLAIVFFQLQFRPAASGANKRMIFAICVMGPVPCS